MEGKLYCKAKKVHNFRQRRAKKKENSNNSHIKLYFRTKIAPKGGNFFWGAFFFGGGGAKILGLEKCFKKITKQVKMNNRKTRNL